MTDLFEGSQPIRYGQSLWILLGWMTLVKSAATQHPGRADFAARFVRPTDNH
jgi:hypothetical protein